MQKNFENILEFTKAKEKCLFCNTPLRASLTNFVGLRKNNLPILNETIDGSGRFSFSVRRTTQNYDIEANAVVDIVTNKLSLTVMQESPTAVLDQHLAKRALDDMMPHIELSCPNKLCKNQYYLCTSVLKITDSPMVYWQIGPLKLYIEGFRTNSLIVQNDWIREETNIYSVANEDAPPIKMAVMDFEEMGKEKLLTRVQTIVTFG